ncbi:mandelate racemase/muconate lactonizing enzyme family protein [Hyphococcus luteus]|uniref:Mandelate racemase/muconate lactonizing enzyme family protein n=1 Tax=Hyphococcus luteus TaxID=2058213 RepID=A0A2S7KAC2_9PROT|nr:mandelate racemase/muconate lactonizing enzyme family protein [Marinicaulis flavus]PQA89399.1 mandelate racemase/muconate lactonizing enzyme family protein [Marinicaulis flavus]
MKVTAAESFVLEVPVGGAIADSMQSVERLEFVGLRVDTDAGVAGCGYTVTVGAGGKVLQAVLDSLYIDELIGEDPRNVRQIWSKLYHGKAHWIGRAGATTMAQAAVDIALWDILAKAAGEPLWRLLGGAHAGKMPIYNTHAGWLNYSVEQLRREAGMLIDQGYRTLKMKVGLDDLSEDLRRVAAVRSEIGDGIDLMVDANQKWDLRKAQEAARRLADFDVKWIEEPLHPDDVRAHAKLREQSTSPIALGEHVYSTHMFRDFIERNGVDVVQVDVCRIGGVTPWLQVASLAESFGLPVCPHAGDLMQVHQHLVKAIPNNWLLEVIPLWEAGPFEHQIQLKDGYCLSPEVPGASTDFTKEAFARFRVS